MEIESNPQETPVLQNPPQSQVCFSILNLNDFLKLDKNSLISRDPNQNTNYSQASENNEDNELTPGYIVDQYLYLTLKQGMLRVKVCSMSSNRIKFRKKTLAR